jgi:cysteine desulfurase / selenocysteine lyase
MSFDVNALREQFPQLQRKIGDHQLVYLDNAATSLKPKRVVDCLAHYYLNDVANIHRGAHTLSRLGTEKYEKVRQQVSHWIGAKESSEIIFTRGVTESMNLISYSYGFEQIGLGDVILLSPFEHHSNIIPWKILAENTGCEIEILPFDQKGQISMQALEKAFHKKIRMVSLMLYSNVTGVRLHIEPVLKFAREKNVVSIVDAAQAMLHEKIDVQKLDCDFLTFSSHKMFGPFGVGVLYGKSAILKEMPPFQGGGSMISSVSWQKTVYQDPPHKFEAGTPNIADVIALGSAIEMIESSSLGEWVQHGRRLGERVEKELLKLEKVKLTGPQYGEAEKTDIVSFTYQGAHAADVGELLDQMGVAVRAGHLCAQPLMDSLQIQGTVRVSLAPYNNDLDVDRFIEAMQKVGRFI